MTDALAVTFCQLAAWAAIIFLLDALPSSLPHRPAFVVIPAGPTIIMRELEPLMAGGVPIRISG